MTRLIATARSGPAFSELPLAEQLARSVEALSHRLWTDEELEAVHEQMDEHLNRPRLTRAGWEATDHA